MSTTNQSNGRKASSTNNSSTNTPSTTPVSTIGNSSNNQTPIQSTTPNNAPKYGTLVPNRVFVGGISANTTETELLQLFSNYGTVKAAKIIQDRAGVSRGYGFITFESEEEAKRLQREADNIVLRERKLNIAPAIKKQPFSRAFDVSSPPTITSGGPAQYFIPASSMPFYQGGVTYFPPQATSADPTTQHQQPPVYQHPTMFPAQSGPPQTATYPSIVYPTQPLYMPQQFPYQPVPYEYNYYPNGGPQYMVGSQGSSQSQPASMQAPGSPPRTPCYNQQLPYNSEPVYYNMPMYGTMDSSTLYQEPLDLANGNLAEDSSYTSTPYTTTTEEETSLINDNLENTSELSSNHILTPTSIDKSRQSGTPVVSLLSLDHQEKDFTAMQSGRRRKIVEPVVTSATNYQINSPVSSNFRHNYVHAINNSQNVTTMPPPNPLNGYLSYSMPSQQFYNSRYRRNLQNNTNDKLNCYNKRCARNAENLGTSPNSASLVDENLNEQKGFRTSSNTYSSAPHSINVENGFVDAKYNNIRNYQSSRNTRGDVGLNVRSHNTYLNNKTMHYRNSSSNYKKFNSHSYNKNNVACKLEEPRRLGFSNAHDAVVQGNNTALDENHASDLPNTPVNTNNPNSLSTPSQIPVSGSQNFIPPARRTRRSVRRGTHAPLSEIGAGDAPLPNTEVTDTCKKLDNLKL